MKRTTLTIAAIVAAIAIYDRTAATSSEPFEPAQRTVSGGPTVVILSATGQAGQGCCEPFVIETQPLTFDTTVTVITDANVNFVNFVNTVSGLAATHNLLLSRTESGFETIPLDASSGRGERSTLAVGNAATLQAGTYAWTASASLDASGAAANGWLRLQIWGCDSPAGCIPGDLNLDGRVDLLDFATLANHFQG